MGRWSETWRMYWPHAIATVLYAVVVWRYVSLGQWWEFFRPFATATFGYMCVVACAEVADWTGTFTWSYESFWTYPPTYVRLVGFVLLAGVILYGF
jgi:hypothetical protein